MTDAPFADSAPRRRRDRDRAAGAPGDVDSWAHLVGLDGRPADGGPPTGPGSPDEAAGSGTPEPLSRRAARLREARTDTDSPTGAAAPRWLADGVGRPPPAAVVGCTRGAPRRVHPRGPTGVPPPWGRSGSAGRRTGAAPAGAGAASGTAARARAAAGEPVARNGAARVAGTGCGQRPACLRPHLRRPPRPRSGGPRARRAAGRAAQPRRDRTAAGGPRSRAGTAGPGGAAAAGRPCNRRAGVGGRPRPRPPRAAVSRSARARAARCRAVRAPRPGGAVPSSRTGQWRSPHALDARRGGDDRGARSEACPGRRRGRRGQGLPGGGAPRPRRRGDVSELRPSVSPTWARPARPSRPCEPPGGRRQPRGHSAFHPRNPRTLPSPGDHSSPRRARGAGGVRTRQGHPRNGQPHTPGGRRRRRGRRRPRRRGGDRPRGAGLPPPRRVGGRPGPRCRAAGGALTRRPLVLAAPACRRHASRRSRRERRPACCAPYLPTRRPRPPLAARTLPRARRVRSGRPTSPWQAHARAGQGDHAVRPAPPPR